MSVPSFRRINRLLMSLAVLLIAPAVARTDDAAAQKLLDEALAHHNAYNDRYTTGHYSEALKELRAAMHLYARGASAFPKNTAFCMGIGVFENVLGHYAPAAEALQREWDILATGFEGPNADEARFLVASELAVSREHLFDYDGALAWLKRALENKPSDPQTLASVARCKSLKQQFADLPKWIADINAPNGAAVDVLYDVTPRSYPGNQQTRYRLVVSDNQPQVFIEISMLYRGKPANRNKTVDRITQIITLVEACYARSGLNLHVTCRYVDDPAKLSPSSGVTVWDRYKPDDLRMGDSRNWAIFHAQGLDLSADVAAATIAHEIGHMLGLVHPRYYPDKPYTDIMTAGYPWAAIESKRVYPGNVRTILSPLKFPAPQRDALARAFAQLDADNAKDAADILTTACRAAPGHRIVTLARANALFDARNFSGAEKAYSDLLAITPYDYSAYYFRGVARIQLKKYHEAIADFTRIVAQHSGGLHAAAYWERANAWQGLGCKDKSASDRKKSDEAIRNPHADPEAIEATSKPDSAPAE